MTSQHPKALQFAVKKNKATSKTPKSISMILISRITLICVIIISMSGCTFGPFDIYDSNGAIQGSRLWGNFLFWIALPFILMVIYWIILEVYNLATRRKREELGRRIEQEKLEKQKKLDEIKAEKKRLEEERSVINNLKLIASSINGAISSMDYFNKKLNARIIDAEMAFKIRAYVPFWDNMEQAAIVLSDIHKRIVSTKNQIIEFNKINGVLKHKMVLDVKNIDMTELDRLSKKLNNLMWMAHAGGIEFAQIYEQRRTNNILIQGFNGLNDAISSLGSSISQVGEDIVASMERSTGAIQAMDTNMIDRMNQERSERDEDVSRALSILEDASKGRLLTREEEMLLIKVRGA